MSSSKDSTEYLSSFGTMRPPRSMPNHAIASTSIEEFHEVLGKSKRIVALCGAGLSAASGLDTFRGAGGMWRNYQATQLATPEAFEKDPGLVWLFYGYRRHKALQAKPNMGHFALAELAKRKGDGFMCITQNVDGLSQRTPHPRSQLKLIHDTLFDLKCFSCDYRELDNFNDPVHPSLAIDDESVTARLAGASKNAFHNRIAFLDPATPQTIDPAELPHCPKCTVGLLRPGVVWFGEPLPEDTIDEIDSWLDEDKVDLILVIGTSAAVYPAAGYVHIAREKGARVVVVNMDVDQLGSASNLRKTDFMFQGDAAKLLPQMLGPIVGDLKRYWKDAASMEENNEKKVEDSDKQPDEEEKD